MKNLIGITILLFTLSYFNLAIASQSQKLKELKFYNHELSLQDVIESIRSWGEVQLILRKDSGINHAFLIKFNEPIDSNTSIDKGIFVNLTGGHGIFHSPFSLRGIYDKTNSSIDDNVVLSNNVILVDIDICDIYYKQEQIYNIIKANPDNHKFIDYFEEKLFFNMNNKWQKKMVLSKNIGKSIKREVMKIWLSSLGEQFKKRGFYRHGSDKCNEPTVEYILKNYKSWENVYMIENIK